MLKDTKFTKGSMKKNLCLLVIFTLLSGCFGSMAFLGSASTTAASGASGNIARGAFTSTVSYGVKKQTGKLPIEHAVKYAEESPFPVVQDLYDSVYEQEDYPFIKN